MNGVCVAELYEAGTQGNQLFIFAGWHELIRLFSTILYGF